jgi:hypothetical protein
MTPMIKLTSRPMMGRLVSVFAGVVVLAAGLGVTSTAVAAVAPGPGWTIQSVPRPSTFSAGQDSNCEADQETCNEYAVTATNVGSRPSEGRTVVRGALPEGLRLLTTLGYQPPVGGGEAGLPPHEQLTCTTSGSSYECGTSEPVQPGEVLTLTVRVLVEPGPPRELLNRAEVQEGSAPPLVTSEPSTTPNPVNAGNPEFGFESFALRAFGLGGLEDTQAADHPGSLTTTIDYETVGVPPIDEQDATAAQESKDVMVDLPLGLVGNPLAAAKCPESDLYGGSEEKRCPGDSQVGLVDLNTNGDNIAHLFKLYNLVPEPGYVAMFGFHLDGEISAVLRARVLPSGDGDYLSIAVPDIPRSKYLEVSGVSLTMFGDPHEHDGESGEAALPATFLTNPSSCSDAQDRDAEVEMDSWIDPTRWVRDETSLYEGDSASGLTGCDLLQFQPTTTVVPETTQTDTPSGYEVDLKVPQKPELFGQLATPDLRDAELTLPEGVSVSPGAADGLLACKASGAEGIELGDQDAISHVVQEGEIEGTDGLPLPAPGHCPAASTIGTVEVTTPLLASPLQGHIYTAEPLCGGAGQPACSEAEAAAGNLFRLYLEAEESGVIVKLEGKVKANPKTGQLTVSFENTPQLPFSELKVRLKGGPRAPLANPQTCGTATSTNVMAPWSALEAGQAASATSSFTVTGCGASTPFNPGLLAQTSLPLAGSYTPFDLTFSRQDGEQDLSGITVQTPPGLLGTLAQVPLCGEPQAAQGTCSAQSLIGRDVVGAGSGSHPFYETGSVYLTTGYDGQPFGLSIVTPATAGPFNLGDIVVRAAIAVNPATAALTVTSGPLPQIIDGVPLRIQTVNVDIDRSGFIFNPTNCDQQNVDATITAAQGAGVTRTQPFAVTGCTGLPFKPSFAATTSGKASKAGGASLNVKITAKPGEANIAKTDLQLPLQLPARLQPTLQHACTEAQFNTNPAGCPEASVVGTATVKTPVLNVPLTGPAYIVSHGGAAFPDVEFVLQADERGGNVEIVLDGETQIKKGVTYSNFEAVPDAPITSFEANLPQGPHSILGTDIPEKDKYDLCGQTLTMPTKLTGQNGATVNQTTKIEVTGCSTSISISSHSVKQKTLTLAVYVPAAGKLKVSGKGVSAKTKTAKGRETITLNLIQNKAGKLHTHVLVSYTPSTGKTRKKQTKTLTVQFKK